MNITWLDGQDANGQFILEMKFVKGTGYLKNHSYEKIVEYYNLFWDCADVVGMTIYNPQNQVVASKNRAKAA